MWLWVRTIAKRLVRGLSPTRRKPALLLHLRQQSIQDNIIIQPTYFFMNFHVASHKNSQKSVSMISSFFAKNVLLHIIQYLRASQEQSTLRLLRRFCLNSTPFVSQLTPFTLTFVKVEAASPSFVSQLYPVFVALHHAVFPLMLNDSTYEVLK